MTNAMSNGKTESNLPSLEVVKTYPKITASANVDWLLHIYYARRDFRTCKVMIGRELDKQLNPEYMLLVQEISYLYFKEISLLLENLDERTSSVEKFNMNGIWTEYIFGLIERDEGNNVKALQYFQKIIDLNWKNIEAFKEIGRTLFQMGHFNQALNVFSEAENLLEQLPRKDYEIFYYIGEILLRTAKVKINKSTEKQAAEGNNEDEAKKYFQKSIEYGNKLESYQRLADIYRKERKYDKAIEVLERCLQQISPDNVEILINIGILCLKLNDTQRALEKLTKAFQSDENSFKGLLAYGAILQSRNDIDDALLKYKLTPKSDLEFAELWNNIGLCFFKKKKFIMAISCLRKAIWLSPLNYNSLYNLGLIFISAHQYASAFQALAAAVNLRRSSPECYMLLGLCLRKLEDYESAFTAFERSKNLLPLQTETRETDDESTHKNGRQIIPLMLLNFALFCYETGRINFAIENYNNFLEYSKNTVLPIDYKFQATKLKSLLKISAEGKANADRDERNSPLVQEDGNEDEIALEVNAVVDEN